MQKFLLLLALLFFSAQGFAQTDSLDVENDSLDVPFPPMDPDPRYLAALADTCRGPWLSSNAVVTYAGGYARAYIAVQELRPGQQVRYRKANSPVPASNVVALNQGAGTINGLQLEQVYALFCTNNCGQEVILGFINTQTGATDRIEVSGILYDAIVKFQQTNGQISLRDFLTTTAAVPFYEKVAFLQQYWYGGAPLPYDHPTQLPEAPPRGGDEDDCKCSFVFNMGRLASPANMNSDGTISPDIKDGEKEYASYGKYWWVRQSRGPAKWHCLWNEASKAGGADRLVNMTMSDSLKVHAPASARLRYNLFCTNYATVPSECGCKKPLMLYWQYDTEVEAHAERHTEGWGTKKAVAGAEDVALVVLHYDGSNTYDVLEVDRARAAAHCEMVVNPAFWDNMVDVAKNVALFFVKDDDPNYQNLVNQLASSLQNLIGTPYYTEQGCDLNATETQTLLHGDKEIFLEPNKPVNLTLSSFSNLMAGGRRSFHSWARINSDFYLAGYVPGGLFADETQNHCCSKKLGDWLLASDGPLSVDDLKEEVGLIFKAFAPWPYPSDPGTGIIRLPTEYGWMAYDSHPECTMSTGDAYDDGNRPEHATGRTELVVTGLTGVKVFDLSGRLLYAGAGQVLPQDLRVYLREKGISNTGIYIVHVTGESRQELHKVIMH